MCMSVMHTCNWIYQIRVPHMALLWQVITRSFLEAQQKDKRQMAALDSCQLLGEHSPESCISSTLQGLFWALITC